MAEAYWLFNWFDAHSVKSVSDVERVLSVPSLVEELREVALQSKEALELPTHGGTAIFAGRGLDLTGKLDCETNSCRIRQVDELFRKAWHYFDRIIVDDVISHQLLHHWEWTLANPKAMLLSHMEVLLYLQHIGAENLVEFREKPEACTVHPEEHAKEAGLEGVFGVVHQLTERLVRESQIEIRSRSKGEISYLFKHPKFEVIRPGTMKVGGVGRKPTLRIRKAIVREVLNDYIPHLTADVRAARSTNVPLGSTIWLHGQLLSSMSETLTPSKIAFQIDLPILQGISVKTLIRIRTEEHESFQRFRDSLRLAIKDRLDTSGADTVEILSEEIRMDVIEPALRRIRDKLAAAERGLTKKTAIGTLMGALVTTCGLYAGLPLPVSIAAGCGTATTAEISALSKYLEEKEETSLSDMFFLWRAVKHVAHEL